MKKLIIIAGIAAAGGGIFYWTRQPTPPEVTNSPAPVNDYKNISYEVEGESVQLRNGTSESEAAPGSAEMITTEYFGNEVKADFNNDGTQDVAFILTQSGGGTGVFYYVVAALKTFDGYKGTNAIILGDRIAPQTTEFHNGQILVNYADRKPGEPFSADPSVGVSKYFKVSGGKLLEVPR